MGMDYLFLGGGCWVAFYTGESDMTGEDLKAQAISIHIITAHDYRELRGLIRRKREQGLVRHDLPLRCGDWLVQMMVEKRSR